MATAKCEIVWVVTCSVILRRFVAWPILQLQLNFQMLTSLKHNDMSRGFPTLVVGLSKLILVTSL